MSGGPPGLHPAGTCNYSFFLSPPKKKPRNTLNNQVFGDAWKSIGRKKTNLYMENGLWNHHFHPLQTGCFEVPGKHERQFASRSGDSTRFTWKKTCGSQFLSEIWAYQKKTSNNLWSRSFCMIVAEMYLGGFKYFFMFTVVWGRFPIWLSHIFQMGCWKTTNQMCTLLEILAFRCRAMETFIIRSLESLVSNHPKLLFDLFEQKKCLFGVYKGWKYYIPSYI